MHNGFYFQSGQSYLIVMAAVSMCRTMTIGHQSHRSLVYCCELFFFLFFLQIYIYVEIIDLNIWLPNIYNIYSRDIALFGVHYSLCN